MHFLLKYRNLDRLGIVLSVLCGIHCLLIPLLLYLLPSFSRLLKFDVTHEMAYLLVMPLAAVSLVRSFWLHRMKTPILLGAVGLLFLALALCVASVSHQIEFFISIVGSLFLIAAHHANLRLCQGH